MVIRTREKIIENLSLIYCGFERDAIKKNDEECGPMKHTGSGTQRCLINIQLLAA